MKRLEGILKNTRHLNLYYQGWLPEGEPRAVLVLVHGLAEHSGRYTNVVSHFVPRGYAVYGLDHQGHGKSPGLRCYANSFSDYPDDLEDFIEVVRQRHRGKPIFLLGHSVGATIAAAYLCRHPRGDVKGFISSAISLKPGKDISPLHIALARLLSKILPRMPVSALSSASISSDLEVVKAYDEDPLVYRGKIRARTGAELLAMMQRLQGELKLIIVPMLALHGDADRLIDPDSSRLLYEEVGSEDKTLKLYPGFCHEVLNEPGRQPVLKDIQDWLEARL